MRQSMKNLWDNIKLINREDSKNEAQKIEEIFLNFLKKKLYVSRSSVSCKMNKFKENYTSV